jgi:guanylate kinase
MANGLLIVLSGPSGVGKKTIWGPLINDKKLKLAFSISMTTRAKRFDEVDKRDYFFVTKQQFKKAIANGDMLEYATYVNNYYGTPKRFVNQLRAKGMNVLLEIESNGALQIMDYAKKNKDKGVVTIFIAPPSLQHLHERLKKRGTESDKKIKERIKQAE